MDKDKASKMSPRVRQLVELRTRLENERWEFAKKHGFAHTRAQNFKNCIVIRWITSRVKYKIVYPKIEEYTKIAHELSDHYNLWNDEDPFLESSLRLLGAGIYVFTHGDHQTWAIPNEYKEVQEYVLSKLPEWAKVSVKK